MSKYYRVADLTIEMDTFGRTLEQAEQYKIDKQRVPDIVISSVIDVVRKVFPQLSDSELEYIGSGAYFYRELLFYNGFQLHSSAVVVDNRAYLFSANSGTGKSTHTKLWLKLFGERAYILNDDKPAVRKIGNSWYAFGTPWSGKNDISVNRGVPVAGICILERGEKNRIYRYGGKNAVLDIYAQSNRPKGAVYRIKLLELLDDLIRNIPIWRLECNMEDEAALVSYRAMSGTKEE